MKERRWPWLISGVIFVGAGAAAWWSTYLSWKVCSGSQGLWQSVFASYDPSSPWSDACYVQMDSGGILPWPDPVAAPWSAMAAILTGAAWLMLVLGLRWSARMRLLAVSLGLVTLAAGVLLATTDVAADGSPYGALTLVIDLAAVVALAPVIEARKGGGLLVARAAIAWFAAASFGAVRSILDYIAMITMSTANWDTPPGTGYLTAWGLAASGLSLIGLTLVGRRASSPATATEQVEQVDPVA